MKVLFLGEGDLSGPARYLAAILTYAKIPFDHRPDQAKIPKSWRRKLYDVVILSDYRASSWTPCAREWLEDSVTASGTGLLMIGGWASFTGLVGRYAGSAISRLLPVDCIPGDDRVQKATGALLVPTLPHSILKGLTWKNPPAVCGYHRVKPKANTQTILSFRDVLAKGSQLRLGRPVPALVTGYSGMGRTAAFMSDCAPHWAGGLVDWGPSRITVRVSPNTSVEVGSDYLRFFNQLIRWLAQTTEGRP